MSLPLLLLILAIAIAVFSVGIYNRLVSLRNRFKNAFSQIDVQLKRRYDLIPNLVETAKRYLQHERDTLEAVIRARNSAFAASQTASKDPADADSMRALLTAEATLGGSLGKLMAVMENYPDLKADGTMRGLMEELTSTENRIAYARQAYNDSAMSYNTTRETFPNNLVSGFFAFKEATLWQIENPAERETVRVSFGA